MYKAFIFLLAVLLLILIGSFVAIVVFYTVDFVKDIIDDWME